MNDIEVARIPSRAGMSSRACRREHTVEVRVSRNIIAGISLTGNLTRRRRIRDAGYATRDTRRGIGGIMIVIVAYRPLLSFMLMIIPIYIVNTNSGPMPHIIWPHMATNLEGSWVGGHIVKGFVGGWNQNVATKMVATCGFSGVDCNPGSHWVL